MYAIVDIETTGGYASNNDITEVAILLHDGEKLTGRFETLIRPLVPIPYFIQVLTGIGHDTVANAPVFSDVAEKIYSLLKDRVFVAHNVNFDYSFLKFHLAKAGFDLDRPKLCTVRLAKKVFPDLRSYSLGNICRHFYIQIEKRHRAGGDADATARLFELMLASDAAPHIRQFLKRNSKEQSLPIHLPRKYIDDLPYTPGVYYFHNQKDQIIYVGKAKNIKYRVSSHFSTNGAGRQRQEFLRNIFRISYTVTGTELMASILESVEIQRLWPRYNSSQKRVQTSFGLYGYEDRNGYLRLMPGKCRKGLEPLYRFPLEVDAYRAIHQLSSRFELCMSLNSSGREYTQCLPDKDIGCRGACRQNEEPGAYNLRVSQAIEFLQNQLPNFALIDESHLSEERTCILVEQGRFYGMGYLPRTIVFSRASCLKPFLTPYPENEFIKGLISQFLAKNPQKKIELPALSENRA